MRRPTAYPAGRGFEVMMTPMIDVVFLLLVFFVCTAGFNRPEEELPSRLSDSGVGGAPVAPRPEDDFEEIVITLRESAGRLEYQVSERRCADAGEVREVVRALAEIDDQLAVILDVAPEVPLGLMIDIYDSCRAAGFERIQFAAH
ncbi:MAG: biopolymer transporter ExbD [Planctomycetia bacterium]|nr:biopolymer transporter ExbD [Planctomycetia bacterium]